MNKEDGGSYRNVIGLGFVSFFTDISTEMILSILPIYIIKELGGSRAVLGLIEGIAQALNYILRTISGIISDKIGRRKVVVFIGYSISNLTKPFLGFAKTWVDALVIRTADRIGKGVRTSARDALLSESISEKRLGMAFGIHRAMDQSGAVIGPLLTIIITAWIGLRYVFWLSFIPGILALLPLIFIVKEKRRKVSRRSIEYQFKQVMYREFLLLLIVVAVFAIGAYNFSFILLRSSEIGIPDSLIPLIYMIINLSHTAIAIPFGSLADKIGKRNSLLISYQTFILSTLFILLSPATFFMAIIFAIIYGIYMGTAETIQRALVAEYVSPELRGTAYGLYYIVYGSMSLIAQTFFGYLWDVSGYKYAFTYSLITSIIASFLLITLIRKKIKSNNG